MYIQLSLDEQTVHGTIAAAARQGLSFSEYVEWRLNVDLDTDISVEVQKPSGGESAQSVDEIAGSLFRAALEQVAEESDEDNKTTAALYLVEDLYKRRPTGTAWNLRDRGNRIMIGKAFKRLVDAQLPGGIEIDDGRRVKVEFDGRTAQNQARYKTVRVG